MKQGFVLFGLRDNSGCTTNAIHIARYFAGGGYSVALIESATIKSPCLRDYIEGDTVPYEKDGVSIYPTWDQEVPDADIMIYDMGTISMAKVLRMPKEKFEFILCASADEDTLFDLSESYTDETKKLNLLILLKECGDIWVDKFKKINFRTFKVGYSRTTCPTVLADNLIQICHFTGILPPEINYDLKEWTSAIKLDPSKKIFFIGKNKKKVTNDEKFEDIMIVEMIPDLSQEDEGLRYDEDGLPIPEELWNSGLKAHERDEALKSKPEKVISSQEEEKKEQEHKRSDEKSETANAKDIIKNSLDSAADVGKTIFKGISNLARKIVPDKKADNEKTDETDTVLSNEGIDEGEKAENTASKSRESEPKDLPEKMIEPLKGTENDPGYLNIVLDKETVDKILNEEKAAVADRDNNEKKKDKQLKLKFAGHLTVFVTALKHGAGSSHVAGVIGCALAASNNRVCFVHRAGTEYPKNRNMCEYTAEKFEEPYSMAKTIIFDRGCLGELTRNELVEMQRSDIKVLVCGTGESDFQALARFIHKAGKASDDWIYVFNLVPSKKKRKWIKELMQDYDYVFLQMCDYDEVPKDVLDMWGKQIKKKLI